MLVNLRISFNALEFYNFLIAVLKGKPKPDDVFSWRKMETVILNQYQLRRFRNLFASLDVPEARTLCGKYRGAFVGPSWVRLLAWPALLAAGLGGWWGKILYEDGRAINIVYREGKFSGVFRMKFRQERSYIDKRQGLTLHYQNDNPFLWLFIVDEVRRLDESTLLGMTRPKIPGLRWLAFPFVLQKQK
jgi:hypothetical protein